MERVRKRPEKSQGTQITGDSDHSGLWPESGLWRLLRVEEDPGEGLVQKRGIT